ncbi:MAG: hypothetical protein ACM3X3_05225 [Betaproteobacteria bacterium]
MPRDCESSARPVASVVREFAASMETKLRANCHKRNWRTCNLGYLRARLSEELAELDEALADGDPYLVLGEAVDVANFAMFIADVAMQNRKGHEKG